MDEEDSPEWRRANTKVRINRSSRALKRISDSDVTSDGEETIELNEATDYEVHVTVGYEHKDSTITLGDTQSEDMTLDRKEDNSITNWKGKEKMDEDDRPSDSQCKNDRLKSQEEGTMKTRSESSDKDNKSELSDDLDNEGVDTNEESVMQKVDKGTSNSEEEAGSEIEADDAKEGITSRNEQDDGTSEINSLNEEINENIPDQIKTEDRDSIEENYRIIKENNTKILTITQTQGPQWDLDTSQMEESRINVTILDQESDNVTVYNKGYDVGLQKKYNNQILHLSRSVSEPTYRYSFKDPLDDLNDLLEAKQNRDSTVTDSAMANPSNANPEKEESSKWDQLESEEENPVPVSEQINSNALSRNATTYELERFKKNALIIFNQENIIGYKPRLGTKQDAEVLSNTFGNYGFEIEEHPDLCRDEIFRELKKFSERDFTDYGCIAVAILTHGSNMGALKAKDRTFYEKDVINFLKAQGRPTLVTKPKVVIIQACRGSKISEAAHVMRLGKLATDHEDRMQQPYTLPVEADTLVMHSTYAGNISLRDETHGSWFIQTLCSKINELAATQDLEAILTDVKREVAIDKVYEVYNRVTHEIEYNKQMPVVTSTLIRKLYLNKYELTVIKTSETSELDNTNVVEDTLRKTYRPSISQPGVEDFPPFAPCICFLDRFEYYRDCISYFVKENPDDETAKSFLDLAEVLQEGSDFNVPKEKISRAIRNHLQKNAKEFDYFKYLYFYKD